MFSELKSKQSYSQIGLIALIVSVFSVVALGFADGIIRGYVIRHMNNSDTLTMLAAWVSDFRFFFEQGMYVGTILFIGAKFIETRTVLSVSFDRLNASRVFVKGPDENNVVWIGHSFSTPIEARVVSDALTERLKQSAA